MFASKEAELIATRLQGLSSLARNYTVEFLERSFGTIIDQRLTFPVIISSLPPQWLLTYLVLGLELPPMVFHTCRFFLGNIRAEKIYVQPRIEKRLWAEALPYLDLQQLMPLMTSRVCKYLNYTPKSPLPLEIQDPLLHHTRYVPGPIPDDIAEEVLKDPKKWIEAFLAVEEVPVSALEFWDDDRIPYMGNNIYDRIAIEEYSKLIVDFLDNQARKLFLETWKNYFTVQIDVWAIGIPKSPAHYLANLFNDLAQ